MSSIADINAVEQPEVLEVSDKPKGLDDYSEIRYLKPEECKFSRTSGGFLSLTMTDAEYPRVNISRAFPLTYPMMYLSVRDKDAKEIGIIQDLNEYEPDVQSMVLDELERRYFAPTIQAVTSLKDEFGYTYWEVETDRGARKFTSRGTESIINLSGGRILILDVDGNRFEIPDYNKLDMKSFKLLDALI